MLRKISFALLCVCSVSVSTSQMLKTVQPEDIVDIRKVTDPQISPDGKLIAYVVEIPAKSGAQKNAHIWLVATDKSAHPSAFISSDRTDTSPRWSPDGQLLAFISDRSNPLAGTTNSGFTFKLAGAENRPDLAPQANPEEEHKSERQIWAIPLAGGEAYPLTDIPGGVKSFKWSKDGKFIAFVRTDSDTKEETERKKRKADHILVDRGYHFDRLWTYDLAAQTARLVSNADLNMDDFDLSPDGLSALIRFSPTPRLNDYWYVSKIAVMNVASGELTKTLTELASPEAVRWLNNGSGKVLYGEKTEHQIASVIVVEDLATGKKSRLGANLKVTLRTAEWNPDGSSLTVAGVEGTRTFFGRLNVSSGSLQKLVEAPADGYAFTQSRDGKTIAYLGQTPNQPDAVWSYTEEAGPRSLAGHNPQVGGWNLGKVQEISWTSSTDGRKIYGVLVLPPGYQPGTPHQTIVHAHGGPFEAWQSGWLGTWYEWAQLLASHGYVVLAPNPRGSQGQGCAFQEANFKDWGGGDFQDIMDGVDLLIKEKIADPARLGIGGWSYGGFMTSWSITHTNRFKAAVVGAAVTDLYGMSTTTDIAPNFLNEFFGNFAENRALYDQHSPMRFIERCHTPALVLHGDADDRVPPFQGAEFYKGLQLLGRESQLVRYPREPHIFTEREHQIDSLQRIIDWFDSHLR